MLRRNIQQGKLRLLVLVLLLSLSTTSYAIVVDVPWDPGIYVGWNDLIVEGTLIRLYDDHRPIAICQGFLFGGQAGSIEVSKVIYNKVGISIACGDTISFFLRTASTSEPIDGITWFMEDPSDSLCIPIGTSGYYAFNVAANGFMPAWHFFIGSNRQLEVNAFLDSLAADSVATIRALKERHSGYRFWF